MGAVDEEQHQNEAVDGEDVVRDERLEERTHRVRQPEVGADQRGAQTGEQQYPPEALSRSLLQYRLHQAAFEGF